MTPYWRLSRVERLLLNEVSHSSVVQLGDNENSVLDSKVLAFQRETTEFGGYEPQFHSYGIFSRSAPAVLPLDPHPVWLNRRGDPEIRVGTVQSLRVTASSLVRIGSGRSLVADSRIKHIRQFDVEEPGTFAESEG